MTILSNLQDQPADPLLALISEFRLDTRQGTIDLGVGVYRDTDGQTPVFRAIKAAERILVETQSTKTYLGPDGDPEFIELLKPIAFGNAVSDRIVGVQTPGGTGALRLAADLIALAKPGATVWIGEPTWSNHAPIFAAAGLKLASYRYFDLARQIVLFDEMISALSNCEPGDVVLLHGCCHNPTGSDLDKDQWRTVIDLVSSRGLLPLVDFAYQGLGRGLEADSSAVREILAAVDEAVIAYSCDKNFGLYRDRTGGVYSLARTSKEARIVHGNLAALARVNWSMPPDHGAAAVRIVLETPSLADDWRAELNSMCQRINAVRAALAAAAPGLTYLTRQQGLFSNLALSPTAIARLRTEHCIYMAGSGRVNLAGLQVDQAMTLVNALASVAGHESALI